MDKNLPTQPSVAAVWPGRQVQMKEASMLLHSSLTAQGLVVHSLISVGQIEQNNIYLHSL